MSDLIKPVPLINPIQWCGLCGTYEWVQRATRYSTGYGYIGYRLTCGHCWEISDMYRWTYDGPPDMILKPACDAGNCYCPNPHRCRWHR